METTASSLNHVKTEIDQEMLPTFSVASLKKNWESHKVKVILGVTFGALALAGAVAAGLFTAGIPYWIVIAATAVTAMISSLGISKLATAQPKELPQRVEIIPETQAQQIVEIETKSEKRQFRQEIDKITSWALKHKGIIGVSAITAIGVKGYQVYAEKVKKYAALLEAAREVEAREFEADNSYKIAMAIACPSLVGFVLAMSFTIYLIIKENEMVRSEAQLIKRVEQLKMQIQPLKENH